MLYEVITDFVDFRHHLRTEPATRRPLAQLHEGPGRPRVQCGLGLAASRPARGCGLLPGHRDAVKVRFGRAGEGGPAGDVPRAAAAAGGQ